MTIAWSKESKVSINGSLSWKNPVSIVLNTVNTESTVYPHIKNIHRASDKLLDFSLSLILTQGWEIVTIFNRSKLYCM